VKTFGNSDTKPTFAIAEIAAKFAECHYVTDDGDDFDDITDNNIRFHPHRLVL
jgi:hypothetical protein